jgi:CheY-like chemotaxis protein
MEVLTVLSVKAQEKGIPLDFEVEGKVPETLLSDPTRLRQIATNLVSNAIKFTDTGGVKVSVGLAGQGADSRFTLRVTDSGIGLPEESYESIFDAFVQADSSVTRRFGGTGLGLPISRRFARMMGGDITVSSVPGEGSTFSVTIDPGPLEGVAMLSAAEATAATETSSAVEAGSWEFPAARILVVDDGDENRELLQLVLEDVGLVVEGAENGQVAVEMTRAGHFDLILMDMQMPVMDGYTATGVLRNEKFQKPIIALTADAMKGFEKKCREAGCSGYLTKPINIDSLIETLAPLLGGRRKSGERARPHLKPTGAPAQKPTQPAVGAPVVSSLAGKNPQFATIVKKFVGRLEERLQIMQTSWDARDFDQLASHAHWLKGSAGTVGFEAFQQPAEALELFARDRSEAEVEGLLREIRTLADRIVVEPNAQAQPAASGARRTAADTGAVTSRLAANPKFRPTVLKFVQRLEENLQVMDSRLDARDHEELAALAHWLKGSSGMVGFDAFSEPAASLEALAREQKWSEIESVLEELHSLADRIQVPSSDSSGRVAGREERR